MKSNKICVNIVLNCIRIDVLITTKCVVIVDVYSAELSLAKLGALTLFVSTGAGVG